MLWDCEKGDCYQIAESLEFCPLCGTPRPERNPVDLPPATSKKSKAADKEAADQILEGFDAKDHAE